MRQYVRNVPTTTPANDHGGTKGPNHSLHSYFAIVHHTVVDDSNQTNPKNNVLQCRCVGLWRAACCLRFQQVGKQRHVYLWMDDINSKIQWRWNCRASSHYMVLRAFNKLPETTPITRSRPIQINTRETNNLPKNTSICFSFVFHFLGPPQNPHLMRPSTSQCMCRIAPFKKTLGPLQILETYYARTLPGPPANMK